MHITCVAADALSEVASTTCADVNAPAASLDLGPHVLTASATDRAGNVGEGSTTFTVTVSAAGLCRLTQQYETKDAVAHSLCVKLDHGSIGAYANELHAQAGKSVTADQAELLIRLAEAL